EVGGAVLGGGDGADGGAAPGERQQAIAVDLDEAAAVGGALRVGARDLGEDPASVRGLQSGEPGRDQQGVDALACHGTPSCNHRIATGVTSALHCTSR